MQHVSFKTLSKVGIQKFHANYLCLELRRTECHIKHNSVIADGLLLYEKCYHAATKLNEVP
jgi:hypothetical protein